MLLLIYNYIIKNDFSIVKKLKIKKNSYNENEFKKNV